MQQFPEDFNNSNLQNKINNNQKICLSKYRAKIYEYFLKSNDILQIPLEDDFFTENIYGALKQELEKLQLRSEITEINRTIIYGEGDNAILKEYNNMYLIIKPT